MGCGSSTRRGGGRKVRALPRKFVFLGFGREEPGMSRTLGGIRKRFCKKKFVRIFRSLRLSGASELSGDAGPARDVAPKFPKIPQSSRSLSG